VTLLTVTNILGKRDRGIIVYTLPEANDNIRLSCGDTGKFSPAVDLVNQLLEVHTIARFRVDGLRGMAGHTVLHLPPTPAVLLQPVMALVARRGLDQIFALFHRRPGRDEIKGRVSYPSIVPAACLRPNSMDSIPVVVLGKDSGKCVGKFPVLLLVEGAHGI
jgi:hypothetical protein